jgi:hypothetical protein
MYKYAPKSSNNIFAIIYVQKGAALMATGDEALRVAMSFGVKLNRPCAESSSIMF